MAVKVNHSEVGARMANHTSLFSVDQVTIPFHNFDAGLD